jgi:hypothetical protein
MTPLKEESCMLNPDPRQVVRVEPSLPDYFRRRLRRHAERLRPSPHEDTLWYLGEMMNRFSRSEHFFDYHDGRLGNRPLALLYGDAQATSNPRQRCLLLQRLGDMALFLGAFFPERYARRGIHRDYFVGMGSAAYDYLAERARQHRHIFRELTQGFAHMQELVARAGSHGAGNPGDRILRLYARWLENGDPAIAAQLRRLGVTLEGGREH